MASGRREAKDGVAVGLAGFRAADAPRISSSVTASTERGMIVRRDNVIGAARSGESRKIGARRVRPGSKKPSDPLPRCSGWQERLPACMCVYLTSV
jgi:hypothetical protein